MSKSLSRSLHKCRRYAKYAYRLSSAVVKRRHHPFKLMWIDPHSVKFSTVYLAGVTKNRNTDESRVHHWDAERGYFSPAENIGRVIANDWDSNIISVEDMPEYRALSGVIDSSENWLSSSFSMHLESLILAGEAPYGFSDIESYRIRRPAEVKNLIDSIRRSGVVSSGSNPFFANYFDNIQVNLGRDGSYLFQGGFHRFCIARILGLKSVPMIVVVTHSDNFL